MEGRNETAESTCRHVNQGRQIENDKAGRRQKFVQREYKHREVESIETKILARPDDRCSWLPARHRAGFGTRKSKVGPCHSCIVLAPRPKARSRSQGAGGRTHTEGETLGTAGSAS